MRALAIALPLLLAGCNFFVPEPKPDDAEPMATQEWGQQGVSDAEVLSDADSCREQARAVVRQDENISADIASRDDLGAFQNESPDLTAGMNEFESRQRYRRIFEDCMRARGYVPDEE